MILFHKEDIRFQLKNKRLIKAWIKSIAAQNNKKIGEINYIFMTDEALLKINKEYLNHDTYTDIITFDNSEGGEIIDSDIYISIERIKENATNLSVEFETELKRVLIHGILHLCGFKDKSEQDTQLMRQKEEDALKIYDNEYKH